MVTWRQLGRHQNRSSWVSTNEYWQPFDTLVDRVVSNDFAHGDATTYFTTVPDPSAAIDFLLDG